MKIFRKLLASLVVLGLAVVGTSTSASAHDHGRGENHGQSPQIATQQWPTSFYEFEEDDEHIPAPTPIGHLSISPRIQSISAIVGEAMTPTLPITADAIFGPLNFSLDQSTLPDGLSIDPASGVVSGTPTTDASLTLVLIDVAGAQNSHATAVMTFDIAPAAIPEATKFIVNFDATTNGGSVNPNQIVYSSDAGAITLPSAEHLAGFEFTGWYDDPSAGNLIGFAGDSYIPTADTVLYAQFVDNTPVTPVAKFAAPKTTKKVSKSSAKVSRKSTKKSVKSKIKKSRGSR